jgi:hypothetical protein
MLVVKTRIAITVIGIVVAGTILRRRREREYQQASACQAI